MKKNIIFLLIDCFDYNKIGPNKYRQSPTPFLDELKSKSLWATNMYSQAPYTEAALIATICGYDTLDRGGHLKRYKNCPETLYEMMKRAGYDVYAQMWTHFYPSSALRGIDFIKLRPYSFETLWHYRFEYYSKLYTNGNLDCQDIDDLIDIIDDNLKHWDDYFEKLLQENDEVEFILKYTKLPNISKQKELLENEIINYNTNKEEYIKELLKKGLNHRLFNIFNSECLNYKVPDCFANKINKKYGNVGEEIYRISNKLNRKNNHLSFKKLWQYWEQSDFSLNLIKRTQFSQYIRNYFHVLRDTHLLKIFDSSYSNQKDFISTKCMMKHLLKWIDSRDSKKDNPYFAYIHTEDIHGQSVIFDICSTDENEIDDQVETMKNYLSYLPRNYKGNVSYDLGLLNVDRQIRWFYEELKVRGILDNTLLIITSDHGCGTNYNPLRGFVQNFHDECYHIPFIILDNDMVPTIDNNYHLTKDIMPTLAELVGVVSPQSCTGESILSSRGRKIVMQEYMGPGCPDMYRRLIWMCAFDDEWKVFIKVKLMQETFEYQIEEVFNRKKDPDELDNLKKNKNALKSCDYLFEALKNRWFAIKKGYARDDRY